jgi:hypothetical protein
VAPVTPLAAPWRRTAAWAMAAALYLGLMVAVASPRADLGVRMRDIWFVLEQGAALATGLLAAVAAFTTAVPGRRRTVVPVALGAAVVWAGLMLLNTLRDIRAAAGEPLFHTDWGCVAAVLAGTVVPAAAMAVMLRRAAALSPHLTAALGGLAAAGLGNLGGCLSHPDTSSLIVLVWHGGTVAAVAGLGAVAGAQLLRRPPLHERRIHAAE